MGDSQESWNCVPPRGRIKCNFHPRRSSQCDRHRAVQWLEPGTEPVSIEEPNKSHRANGEGAGGEAVGRRGHKGDDHPPNNQTLMMRSLFHKLMLGGPSFPEYFISSL